MVARVRVAHFVHPGGFHVLFHVLLRHDAPADRVALHLQRVGESTHSKGFREGGREAASGRRGREAASARLSFGEPEIPHVETPQGRYREGTGKVQGARDTTRRDKG